MEGALQPICRYRGHGATNWFDARDLLSKADGSVPFLYQDLFIEFIKLLASPLRPNDYHRCEGRGIPVYQHACHCCRVQEATALMHRKPPSTPGCKSIDPHSQVHIIVRGNES